MTVPEQKKLERVDDERCVCGHWHDGCHDTDGTCLVTDCPCINDGENLPGFGGQGDADVD